MDDLALRRVPDGYLTCLIFDHAWVDDAVEFDPKGWVLAQFSCARCDAEWHAAYDLRSGTDWPRVDQVHEPAGLESCRMLPVHALAREFARRRRKGM